MNYVRPMSSKGVTEVETGSSPVLRLWVEPLLFLINGIFLARLFRQIAVKAEVFFRCQVNTNAKVASKREYGRLNETCMSIYGLGLTIGQTEEKPYFPKPCWSRLDDL